MQTKLQKPLTIHWDEKLNKDLTKIEKVDRLQILVSSNDLTNILQPKDLQLKQEMSYIMLFLKLFISKAERKYQSIQI